MSGGIWTFNVQDGFAEAFIRGQKQALLSIEDYRRLGTAETLDDLRSALEDSDYGTFLQDEAQPLSVTTIGTRCREKLSEEFRYLQGMANYPLRRFLEFIVAERMIDNVVSLIQGTLNHKNIDEMISRANPLGWTKEMKAIMTLDPSSGYDDVYRNVLVETPVGKYFEDYLTKQDDPSSDRNHGTRNVAEVGEAFSDIDLEIMRASLKKSWLEDFYYFCMDLGGDTAEVMGYILKVQADFLVLSVTLNSLGSASMSSGGAATREELFPSFGFLYPAGTDALRKAYNDLTIKAALEPYKEYYELYEQCRHFYMGHDDQVGTANQEPRGKAAPTTGTSLEDAIYKREVKLYELAFEQSMHYGIFYAWVKLKEQEIRNIIWIADMILMKRREEADQIVPIFAPRY